MQSFGSLAINKDKIKDVHFITSISSLIRHRSGFFSAEFVYILLPFWSKTHIGF
jgi:hypothetical protein